MVQRLPRPKKADIVAAWRDLKQTRFLADESVEVAVAVLLRRQGFNVVHKSEAGCEDAPTRTSELIRRERLGAIRGRSAER